MIDRRAVLAAGAGLVLGGCGTVSTVSNSAGSTTSSTTSSSAAPIALDEGVPRDPIVIPLTLYRLLDGGELGTVRTADGISLIGERVNEIWAQANIAFDPLLVRDIEVSSDLLAPIVATGNIDPFIDGLRTSVNAPDPGVFNGFYLSAAFGVNGFAPTGTRTFFVVDEPTVHDERVSSHEIGHLLGLHHDADDPDQLMFSGTNGTTLDGVEQAVSRYIAQGVLSGQR